MRMQGNIFAYIAAKLVDCQNLFGEWSGISRQNYIDQTRGTVLEIYSVETKPPVSKDTYVRICIVTF